MLGSRKQLQVRQGKLAGVGHWSQNTFYLSLKYPDIALNMGK